MVSWCNRIAMLQLHGHRKWNRTSKQLLHNHCCCGCSLRLLWALLVVHVHTIVSPLAKHAIKNIFFFLGGGGGVNVFGPRKHNFWWNILHTVKLWRKKLPNFRQNLSAFVSYHPLTKAERFCRKFGNFFRHNLTLCAECFIRNAKYQSAGNADCAGFLFIALLF